MFNTKPTTMRKIFIAFFISTTFVTFGQQDEQMSLYMYNPLYFNPAYAGSRDAISTVALARFQWVGYKGAPMSQWFSAHAPILHKSMGIGGHVINDQIGSRTRTSVYLDVNSSIQLNKNQDRLAVGITGGFDAMGYDFSNSTVIDQTDPYYGSSFSTTKPNFGAGIYYYGKKHYVGFSVPRLFESKIEVNNILEKITKRHFFVSAGYVFDLNSVFKLKPSTLIKYTPNSPITIDANVSLLMYDKLWTGLMYRFHEAMGVNIVYNIKQTFSVGYVYDFPINGLRSYQSGSHEIMLQFDIKPKKQALTSPRYF
jgi:type IX secretion system PorP/SprF family membrane protein